MEGGKQKREDVREQSAPVVRRETKLIGVLHGRTSRASAEKSKIKEKKK